MNLEKLGEKWTIYINEYLSDIYCEVVFGTPETFTFCLWDTDGNLVERTTFLATEKEAIYDKKCQLEDTYIKINDPEEADFRVCFMVCNLTKDEAFKLI